MRMDMLLLSYNRKIYENKIYFKFL